MGFSRLDMEQYLAEVKDGLRYRDPIIEADLAKQAMDRNVNMSREDADESFIEDGGNIPPSYLVDRPESETRQRDGKEPLRLDLMTGAEFAAGDWTIPDLIPGVLTQGEPCVLAGPMKSCKTTASIDLIASLDLASPFLGKFPIPERRNAGLVSIESGRATIQETANRIYASKGGSLAESVGTYWGFDIPPLDDEGAPDMLVEAITQNALDCLILDPLYLLLSTGGDESSVFSMGKMLKPIGEVCQRTGATVILAHHARKNRPNHFAPLELHEIAYSGTAEFARQWLLLARRSEFDPVNGKHELWLSYGGSAGNSGLWGLDITEGHRSDDGGRVYVPEILAATDAREEAAEAKGQAKAEEREARNESILAKRQAHVARYLARYPEGDTEARIGSGCSMAPKTVRPVILAMHDADLIRPVKVQRDNRKTPYEGWQLTPEPGELDLSDNAIG